MRTPVRESFILKVEGVFYTLRTMAEVRAVLARYIEDGDSCSFTLKRVRP